MPEVAHAIDLNLAKKLREDPAYRQRFFWAEASAEIAAQLIALRKRRQLSQKQVAELAGTKQPAISRAEQADYQNWNINTFRSIAGPLDARVRVLIQPSEDVLHEYEENEGRNLLWSSSTSQTVPNYQASTLSNNIFLSSPTLLDLPHLWSVGNSQAIDSPYTKYTIRGPAELGIVANSDAGATIPNILIGSARSESFRTNVSGAAEAIAIPQQSNVYPYVILGA
jgi:transcriptional regulator with XRE-family HTH domain